MPKFLQKPGDIIKCNLNCPIEYKDVVPCCRRCGQSYESYKTKENEHLWTEQGFWSKDGCRLERDDMPEWCKDYDCRNYNWIAQKVWDRDHWATTKSAEVGILVEPGKIIKNMVIQIDIVGPRKDKE